MTEVTHAISLWQPMAWAIAHGTKRIENRTWKFPPRFTGATVAVHAAKKFDRAYAEFICDLMGVDALPEAAKEQGSIIGVMRLVRCITGTPNLFTSNDDPLLDDAWFMGPVGWVVDEVIALPHPIPCRGYQQFWRIPDDIRVDLMQQLRELNHGEQK